jgi:hypothetical protein
MFHSYVKPLEVLKYSAGFVGMAGADVGATVPELN